MKQIIPLIFVILFSGCITGSFVKNAEYVDSNDFVLVSYTGTLTNGEMFDSGTINITMGSGQVISGFEKALLGMAVGQEKTVTIFAKEAYGNIDTNLIFSLPIDILLQNNITPKQGIMLQMQSGARAVIREFNDTSVVLDFNNPLAGKDLVFKIKVESIKKS